MTGTLTADELIALGRELIDRVGNDTRILEVKTDRIQNMAHAPIIFGLAQHSVRLGVVILDLYEADKRLEAMPLVRSLYEGALTAQWLAQSREAVGAWFNEDVRLRRMLSKDLARSASEIFKASASEVAHLDAEDVESIAGNQARHFSRLCDALQPGGAHAYAMYRIMSSYTHPSSTLVDHYAQRADNDDAGVVLRQEPHTIGHDAWLYISVASMMWASRALDVMHRDRPHREYLRSVARQLQVAEVLDLTPEARAAEDRAERERRRSKWKGPRRRRRRATLTPESDA